MIEMNQMVNGRSVSIWIYQSFRSPLNYNYQFQAQSNLETLYSRFLRDKVGWKKASHRYLNQKYLLAQLHECMLIYTMENLQIDELSNSNKNNPLEAMT